VYIFFIKLIFTTKVPFAVNKMQKQICQKGINIYVTYDEQPLSTSVNVVTIKEGEKQTPKSSLNS
jgi:hypothetical protein